ncbi:MAG: protein kinase [Acidobacteria bacterium]|nr:protein kinase [Acidobacteriota bacterium]
MKIASAEQYKQVKSLFSHLKDLPCADQTTYLDSNCQDQQIRASVEALLFHYTTVNNYWPEPETETGSEFANKIEELEPFLTALSKTKSCKPIELIQNEFEGTARFSIQKRLGAGGFGVVYHALDREWNCSVALKVLKKSDGSGLYRFKREFRTLVDVNHPNLVTLYELFSQGDQWFFTMELINGRNFIEYVRNFPSESDHFSSFQAPELPCLKIQAAQLSYSKHLVIPEQTGKAKPCQADLEKLYPAVKQLVTGLLALHGMNKLHGDIKPSNVLVTEDKRVVILDFGLAREVSHERGGVVSDGILGTPAYMSPEQALGRTTTVASDWYSMGVILYEALSGRVPFGGSDIEILLKKQRYAPPMLSDLVSGLPDPLVRLCMALLHKDPRLRPSGEHILETIQTLETNADLSLNPTATPGDLSKVSFVGREIELALLNQTWESTKQGQPATIFVKGPSGIGKSTLVRHFLEQLPEYEKPGIMFWGRCYEQESVPYKVLDSLVDQVSQYLAGLPAPVVNTLLPVESTALGILFPVFQQIKQIGQLREGAAPISDPLEMRRLAFKALKQVLANLAGQQGLILFIDDLQWGDLDSVGLVREILQPPGSPRMLFIGSYQSEEVERSQFLQAFFSTPVPGVRQAQRIEIDLHGLSACESEQLAVLFLGTESNKKHAEKIAQEAGGSPFFIGELAKYLTEKNRLNPSAREHEKMSLEQVISFQVESLSDQERTVLELVAVAGQPITGRAAKAASRLEHFENHLTALRCDHFIRSTGKNYSQEVDTYHDKIREVVIGQLTPEVLKKYHSTLGQALEGITEIDFERLAKHFRLAEVEDKAFDYTIRAARQAEKSFAFERAADLYRQLFAFKRASDPEQIGEIQIEMANALANAGQGAEAAKAYFAAANHCNEGNQLNLQHKAAEQFLNAGQIEQGVRILNQVLEKVGEPLSHSNLKTLFSIGIGRTKLWLSGINHREKNESEIPNHELVRINALFTAVDSLFIVNILQAYDLQTKHFWLALKAGEPYRLTRAFVYEAIFSALGGTRKGQIATNLIERAENLAHRTANPESKAMVDFGRGFISFTRGEWKNAWESFCGGEAITRKECLGKNNGFALRGIENSVVWALRALFYRGEMKLLRERLPVYLDDGKARENLLMLTNLETYIVYLNYLAEDRPEKALRELEQTRTLWSQGRFGAQDNWKLLGKAEIGLYSSNPGPAWAEILRQWPQLKRAGVLSHQMGFIQSFQFQARVALAMAQNQRKASSFLKLAETNARQIQNEKMLFAEGWAELIFAGIEATRGRTVETLKYLHSAENKLAEADMKLYAAAACRRRGELLANDEGKALIQQSEAWMIEQEIKNPARMADMLVPGNWKIPGGDSQ